MDFFNFLCNLKVTIDSEDDGCQRSKVNGVYADNCMNQWIINQTTQSTWSI
jgi:hypothetical protein